MSDNNIEKKRAYDAARYIANRERILNQVKAFSVANREKVAAYKAANSERRTEYNKIYYAANREKLVARCKAYRTANRDRETLYGLAPGEYGEMYLALGGHCQICGVYKDVLNIDHDHNTGKVRGLLCGNCNKGIGRLKDNPEILTRAANYLILSTDVPVPDDPPFEDHP